MGFEIGKSLELIVYRISYWTLALSIAVFVLEPRLIQADVVRGTNRDWRNTAHQDFPPSRSELRRMLNTDCREVFKTLLIDSNFREAHGLDADGYPLVRIGNDQKLAQILLNWMRWGHHTDDRLENLVEDHPSFVAHFTSRASDEKARYSLAGWSQRIRQTRPQLNERDVSIQVLFDSNLLQANQDGASRISLRDVQSILNSEGGLQGHLAILPINIHEIFYLPKGAGPIDTSRFFIPEVFAGSREASDIETETQWIEGLTQVFLKNDIGKRDAYSPVKDGDARFLAEVALASLATDSKTLALTVDFYLYLNLLNISNRGATDAPFEVQSLETGYYKGDHEIYVFKIKVKEPFRSEFHVGLGFKDTMIDPQYRESLMELLRSGH